MQDHRPLVGGGEGRGKANNEHSASPGVSVINFIRVGVGCREGGAVKTAFIPRESRQTIEAVRRSYTRPEMQPNSQLPGAAEERSPAGQGGRVTARRRGDRWGRGAGQRALAVVVVVGEVDHHLQRLARVRVGQSVGRIRPNAVGLQGAARGIEPLPLVRGVVGDVGRAFGIGDAAEVRRPAPPARGTHSAR